MEAIDNKEVSLPLGIIVEKRKSSHPWADWNWKPVAVFHDISGKTGDWAIMQEGQDFTRYHAANLPLILHRKETEALRLNLMLDEPELYVILRENPDAESEFPWYPFEVTASPYTLQDYTDVGEDIVEKVAMPEAIAVFIQAFVERHHEEEEFKKRRRDRIDVEEHKFGKTPIFKPRIEQ